MELLTFEVIQTNVILDLSNYIAYYISCLCYIVLIYGMAKHRREEIGYKEKRKNIKGRRGGAWEERKLYRIYLLPKWGWLRLNTHVEINTFKIMIGDGINFPGSRSLL